MELSSSCISVGTPILIALVIDSRSDNVSNFSDWNKEEIELDTKLKRPIDCEVGRYDAEVEITDVEVELDMVTLRVETGAIKADTRVGSTTDCELENVVAGLTNDRKVCCSPLTEIIPEPPCSDSEVGTATFCVGHVVSLSIKDGDTHVTAHGVTVHELPTVVTVFIEVVRDDSHV